MKSIGQIMEEMGFDPKSPPSSKAAFIKYLAKQAYNVDLQVPEIYQTEEESGEQSLDSFLNRETPEEKTNVKSIFKTPAKTSAPQKEEQLEFSLEKDDFKIAE